MAAILSLDLPRTCCAAIGFALRNQPNAVEGQST
jgi:hypothetical protein